MPRAYSSQNYQYCLYTFYTSCAQINVTGAYGVLFSIGVGNSMVPLGKKSLSEPRLTQLYVVICRHKMLISLF